MFEPVQDTQRRRSALLAGILVVVLAASIGAAWWLVQSRSGPHRRGEEILDAIRQGGLGAYWQAPHMQWFIRQGDGQNRAWRMTARFPEPDGGHQGLHVFVDSATGQTKWEHWRLNATATEGSYAAGEVLGGRRLLATTDTIIRLSGGRIEVQQLLEGRRLDSSAAVPGNYAPEGMAGLVRRLVARRKTTAAFRLVFNAYPPSGQTTYLGTAQMRYDGKGDPVGGRPTDRVVVQLRSRRFAGEKTYDLDANGNVVRVLTKAFRETAVSKSAVRARFPDAADLIRRLIKLKKWKFAADGW